MNRLERLQSLKMIMHLAAQIVRHGEDRVDEHEQKKAGAKDSGAEIYTPEYFAALAEAEYRLRQSRGDILPRELFSDPAWDILLDLFMRECRGQLTSVTSSCIASLVPPTTALRYLTLLENHELVYRVRSERDTRVWFIRLTNNGRTAMTRYFERQVDASKVVSAFIMAQPESREDLIEP